MSTEVWPSPEGPCVTAAWLNNECVTNNECAHLMGLQGCSSQRVGRAVALLLLSPAVGSHSEKERWTSLRSAMGYQEHAEGYFLVICLLVDLVIC